MVVSVFRSAEIIGGAIVAALTLLDVFDTVVVPGASQGWLRVAQHVRWLSLPLWRRLASRRNGAPRIARGLAPFILTVTFSLWMTLLLLAYGLIDDGMQASFKPPLQSLPEAIYTAGLGLVTTGMSDRAAVGPARWVVLISGVSGLAVLTMAVTYILEVQNGLQRRDAALTKLSTTAGRPPSGIALLETYAALGCCSELGGLFREWRDWSAEVLHSHSSNPVLAYFRSISAEMDWPLAVGTVLDAASLYAAFVGGDEMGPAMLLHRDGARLTASLSRLFGIEHAPPEAVSEDTLTQLEDRLEAAGYHTKRNHSARARFLALRRDYEGRLDALCEHFGIPGVELLSRHESHISASKAS